MRKFLKKVFCCNMKWVSLFMRGKVDSLFLQVIQNIQVKR
ncbi:hypothetical protein STANM309S_00253 [Streptomyces tanashiensis]